jgi:hypothetical protein
MKHYHKIIISVYYSTYYHTIVVHCRTQLLNRCNARYNYSINKTFKLNRLRHRA